MKFKKFMKSLDGDGVIQINGEDKYLASLSLIHISEPTRH